jgi:hypothetical protein
LARFVSEFRHSSSTTKFWTTKFCHAARHFASIRDVKSIAAAGGLMQSCACDEDGRRIGGFDSPGCFRAWVRCLTMIASSARAAPPVSQTKRSCGDRHVLQK